MKPTILTLLILLATTLTSCDQSFDQTSANQQVEISLSLPDGVNEADLRDATVTFSNLSSATVSQFRFPPSERIEVFTGIYDVEFSAKLIKENGVETVVKGVARSVAITSPNTLVCINTFVNIDSDDLIISEIFFTGTLQDSGNQYLGDDYVKLYNNTDHVVYADGLTFFETKFLTTQKLMYDPDIMAEAVTVDALYTIPGSGREHPVMPGEYVLLADVGIDHRSVNPNSFSLLHADWEWYDISTSPSHLDIDSPDVPNLDKWYCYTLSFFLLHNRGFKAYGIARIPIDKETYLRDYYYTYNYELITNVGTFPMSQSAYKLPNEWIVDVVNCSVASNWQWNVTAPSLDMGWTGCGSIDHDKSRYFKSVRRKFLYLSDQGHPVLQDTNNSALDFNGDVTPSEIELQHTPTGLGSSPANIITYDGVTPVE